MNDPFEILKKSIELIQEQQQYPRVAVQATSHIVNDLGFASLDIAQMIAMLESELGVDPFSRGVTLDQVATVSDLIRVYSAVMN